MAVAITNDLQRARLLRVLYELLALERGVLECYEAMPRHLDHAVNEQLESFKEDHRSHARELAACVVELGGRVNGDAGRSSALDLETSDGPFTPLMLMWTNEDEMARAYEEALSRRILLPRVRQVLVDALGDAHQHWAWLALRVETERRLEEFH